MKEHRRSKVVREGRYLAEVDLGLLLTKEEWSPYLSLADAFKLDEVRDALRKGDVAVASRYGRVLAPRTPEATSGDE